MNLRRDVDTRLYRCLVAYSVAAGSEEARRLAAIAAQTLMEEWIAKGRSGQPMNTAMIQIILHNWDTPQVRLLHRPFHSLFVQDPLHCL